MFRLKIKLSDTVFEAVPFFVLLKVLYETKIQKKKEKKKNIRYSTSVRSSTSSTIKKYLIFVISSITLLF